MKISGKVENANTDEALSGVKIELSVDETELAILYTDAKGRFETSQSGDFYGKTLVCKVEKDEFEVAETKLDIGDEEIRLNIELIPVYVPPVMITIAGTVVDEKSKKPLEGAKIELSVDGTVLVVLNSDERGKFEHSVPEEYIGKTMLYNVKRTEFENAEIKQEIKKKENTLNIKLIPVYVPPVMIAIVGTVVNEKSRKPLEGAKIGFSVDGAELVVLHTDADGKFEHSVPEEYIGKTILYRVEKDKFENAEIKQDIKEKENTLSIKLIPVHISPKKITIKGSIVDDESNVPINEVYINFKVGGEQIKHLKTATDGSFSLEVDGSYAGKRLEYESKKEHYQLLKGKTEISEDMGALDLRLTKVTKKAKSKKWFLIIIEIFVVVLIIWYIIAFYLDRYQ